MLPFESPAHAASNSGESGGVNALQVFVADVATDAAGDDASMTRPPIGHYPYQLGPPSALALKKKSFVAAACPIVATPFVPVACAICRRLSKSV